MSEVKVNKISPRTACGTVTLGDSGDTIALGAGGHDAPNQSGTAGTDNTGGGGGGNGPTATSSGSGGSGIVIIRYKFQ